jgi:hypothetical protein
MSTLIYVSHIAFLLIAQIGAMEQMKNSLEEIDIERFLIWTCIASCIADLAYFYNIKFV